jgi:hypothetical protein
MMTAEEKESWELSHPCEVCGESDCLSCSYDDDSEDEENE